MSESEERSTDPPSRDRTQWLESVFRRYERPLLRYVLRIVGDLEAARETVQDAFLELCRAERREVAEHVAPWLFAVCRNRAFDLRRKGRLRAMQDTTDRIPDETRKQPGAAAEARESTSIVGRLLAALPANQQEVIRLRFQEGLSYKEIGTVTGLSVSNVGFLMHTGLKRLRGEYAKDALAAGEGGTP